MRAHENPFRVDRIDTLAFEPQGTTWPSILERLARLDHRAAVVGPKGSGKSTFLRDLAPHLAKRRLEVRRAFSNRDRGTMRLREIGRLGRSIGPREVLLFDGGCHLPALHWSLLLRSTRRAGGLVITAHRPGRLPTLFETRTSPELLARLAMQLAPEGGVHRADVLFRAHRGNLRESFRALYDAEAQRAG